MTTITLFDLDFVTGGADPTPSKATYLGQCGRGAVDGGLAGAGAGASMLPFAAASGPLTPATIGTFIGVGAAGGAAVGCATGAWELYKARNPTAP